MTGSRSYTDWGARAGAQQQTEGGRGGERGRAGRGDAREGGRGGESAHQARVDAVARLRLRVQRPVRTARAPRRHRLLLHRRRRRRNLPRTSSRRRHGAITACRLGQRGPGRRLPEGLWPPRSRSSHPGVRRTERGAYREGERRPTQARPGCPPGTRPRSRSLPCPPRRPPVQHNAPPLSSAAPTQSTHTRSRAAAAAHRGGIDAVAHVRRRVQGPRRPCAPRRPRYHRALKLPRRRTHLPPQPRADLARPCTVARGALPTLEG